MTRCIQCRAEFTGDDPTLIGATSCPSCHADSTPMDTCQDTSININWHELRILTIWASNYVRVAGLTGGSTKTLDIIIKHLEAQRQSPDWPALTLMGEVAELRNAGYDATLVEADTSKIKVSENN